MPLKDLGLFYKLYRRQEESRDFEDDREGAAVRDARRQLFSSLAKGRTLNFVDVLSTVNAGETRAANDVFEEDPPADGSVAETIESADPFASGLLSKQRGAGAAAMDAAKAFDANPYPAGSTENRAWAICYYRRQGCKAHDAGAAMRDCPHSTGTDGHRAWRDGWQTSAGDAKAPGGLVTAR